MVMEDLRGAAPLVWRPVRIMVSLILIAQIRHWGILAHRTNFLFLRQLRCYAQIPFVEPLYREPCTICDTVGIWKPSSSM